MSVPLPLAPLDPNPRLLLLPRFHLQAPMDAPVLALRFLHLLLVLERFSWGCLLHSLISPSFPLSSLDFPLCLFSL
eukprot:5744988-Pleurochrysis_carterae.AAC.2